jgi:hypothetical protein
VGVDELLDFFRLDAGVARADLDARKAAALAPPPYGVRALPEHLGDFCGFE